MRCDSRRWFADSPTGPVRKEMARACGCKKPTALSNLATCLTEQAACPSNDYAPGPVPAKHASLRFRGEANPQAHLRPGLIAANSRADLRISAGALQSGCPIDSGPQCGQGCLTLQLCRSGDRKSTRLNSSHLVISYAV